jgi:hypothetical protein
MSSDRVTVTQRMIERYNAQDADGYVAVMTADACEAGYRGAVLREGKEAVREGLKAMFAQFPENRAEILSSHELGEYVVLHERVSRSSDSEPFEVMFVYSFLGDQVSRVEFIR